MSKFKKTFKELYLADQVSIEQLDDFIDEWHTKYSGSKTLQEFLGLTDEENQACMHGETNLKRLLDKQKTHKSVAKFSLAIAERSK